ncbi:hypothetical protein [Novipirellula maiorica]|uniref:hypothetical protein n=1 Tax=Novipirellula maiorica TaxID=1265734 RepID=UPI00034A144D|nr:hypothetical protein [Rhodopirellula maiorica]
MNNLNSRATRAIVASVSLLAIIAIGIPWVDEYFRLRSEARELRAMDGQFTQVTNNQKRLRELENQISTDLASHLNRSIDPEKSQEVRSTLIAIIRDAGGRLRSLEISKGRVRPWAIENDDPREESPPQYSDESDYILHTHEIELRIDGSLETVTQILRGIAEQGWYLTTNNMVMMPTEGDLPVVASEMRLIVFGLSPKPIEDEDEFARHPRGIRIFY